MPKFDRIEDQALSSMDFKRGRLSDDQPLGELQKASIEEALECQQSLVPDVYTELELKRNQKWTDQEENRRYDAKQYEYTEKVQAAVGTAYLFENFTPEGEKAFVKALDEGKPVLNTTAVSRFDQLKNNVDMILNFTDGQAIALYVGTDFGKLEKKTMESIEAAREGKGLEKFTANIKYLDDENIRQQDIPRVELFMSPDEAKKMVDVISENLDAANLSDKENEIKQFIKRDISEQLRNLIENISYFVANSDKEAGATAEELNKAKELLKKLETFKKLFK